ncbi:hypothetical protein JMJ35_007296 [Cladonia borealis]|uniref:Uncharacterized protein n=1 Tax=Cladonia borealis TaxID=184061 RepID=A0AA39QVA8_9LECA|nr:hypothetical protein JMJ35_007296 [Cladonia borealis]
MTLSVSILVFGLVWSTSVAGFHESTTKRDGETTVFGDCSIPKFSDRLPFYTLAEPVAFPTDILRDFLTSTYTSNDCNETHQHGSSFFYDGDRLAALYDNSTGQTSLWPRLESLNPVENISIPFDHFSEYLNDSRIFPPDDTRITAAAGSTLFGSKNSSGSISPPQAYLANLAINRTFNVRDREYAICGPGTKGFFGYGSDGNILSLTHRWQPAKQSEATLESISSDQVTKNILDQLSASNISHATVNSVDFCFYDSGEKYIQPVYRFQVTGKGPHGAAPFPFVGYISAVSKPLEPLPSLTPSGAPSTTLEPDVSGTSVPLQTPSTPASNFTHVPSLRRRHQQSTTVGVYPISNSGSISTLCDADVEVFLQGLNDGKFTIAQNYWGEDFEYESEKNDFVNSVDLVYQCGHGNIHQFYADLDESPVTMADIGSGGGYGPGAGGPLSYWLIKACDVIPTITQYTDKFGASAAHEAWDVWWDVFDGIHVIAGFSTEAWTNDGIEGPLAQAIELNAGVVMSWLNTVMASSLYQSLAPYPDPNWGTQKYGRPAAIFPCGHGDDTVLMRDNLGKPDCLTMFWY